MNVLTSYFAVQRSSAAPSKDVDGSAYRPRTGSSGFANRGLILLVTLGLLCFFVLGSIFGATFGQGRMFGIPPQSK